MKSKGFLWFVPILFFCSCQKEIELEKYYLNGEVFGTNFNITYFDHKDRLSLISTKLDSIFDQLNQSVSTYISNSAISRINQGEKDVVLDAYFLEVFDKSKRIFDETGGVFDPTVGNLVNAWGFGPGEAIKQLKSSTIDSLLKHTGFDNIVLIDQKIRRTNPVTFDFNAIAKGFGLDLAGRYFEKIGIQNYLIELGGEIRTKGTNLMKNKKWRVAIEQPNFDGSRSIERIVSLSNQVMATSGSYRKFKLDTLSGQRYHHIINPKTGYPSKSNILSASVISEGDCADVDAYATALMAMSLHEAKLFLNKNPKLIAYLIFSNEDGIIDFFSTSNFEGLDDSL